LASTPANTPLKSPSLPSVTDEEWRKQVVEDTLKVISSDYRAAIVTDLADFLPK